LRGQPFIYDFWAPRKLGENSWLIASRWQEGETSRRGHGGHGVIERVGSAFGVWRFAKQQYTYFVCFDMSIFMDDFEQFDAFQRLQGIRAHRCGAFESRRILARINRAA